MAEYSEEEQRRKVLAGFRGGPHFKNPMTPQKMTFVDGIESETKTKLQMKPAPQQTPTDPWFSRRNK